jgi:hypothetical protein
MRPGPFLLAVALLGATAAFGKYDPPAAFPPDPEIQRMVAEISAERIRHSIEALARFQTRHTLSDPSPTGVGIGAARHWIRDEFQRISAENGGRLQVAFDSFIQTPQAPRIPHPVNIVNVVAILPGSRPESAHRIFVVSGHYDSRTRNVLDAVSQAPGADDDASGVAAVLEAARVMSKYQFGATLVFMAVASEEQGLNGSTHWAQQARKQSLDVAGMLDNDIIGSSRDADGNSARHLVRLFAQGIPPLAHLDDAVLQAIQTGGENDLAPRELARAVREIGAAYVPSMEVHVVYRVDRYMRGGDQESFLESGFAAVRFTEPAENFLHEHESVKVENGVAYGDLPAYVDFGYVSDVTRLNTAALAVLARAPATPRQAQIEIARLENDTTLRWAPNSEPDLAGYRVVWRDTTAPFWEHALDFGKEVTRTTIPKVSKDNFIFGIEAFDSAGHVSPATYPLPRRTL